MPKVINIDAIQSLTEPIELVLGGQHHKIEGLNQDIVDRVLQLAEESADGESLHRLLSEQLAVFTGAPVEQFLTLDIRQLNAAVKRLIQVVSEAGEKAAQRPKRFR